MYFFRKHKKIIYKPNFHNINDNKNVYCKGFRKTRRK